MGRERGSHPPWVTRPEGGFVPVAVSQLASIAWLLREKTLKRDDARLWAAGLEIAAERRAFRADCSANAKPLPRNYRERFDRSEFEKLTGRKLGKSAFAALRKARVMTASSKGVDFSEAADTAVGDREGFRRATSRLDRLGPDGLFVPFPRRWLRWLAENGSRGQFTAVFAALVSASRFYKGRCSLVGTGTVCELAELLCVNERRLRQDLRHLEELGLFELARIEGGFRFELNPTWSATQDDVKHQDEAPLQNDAHPHLVLVEAEDQTAFLSGSVCQTDKGHGEHGPKMSGCSEPKQQVLSGCTTLRENSPTENTRTLRPGAEPQSGFSISSAVGEKTDERQQPALRVVTGGKPDETQAPSKSQPSQVSPPPGERDGSHPLGRAERSEPKIPADRRLPEPTLFDLRPEDLEPLRAPRRDALYRQGVELGWWPEGEFYRREVECMAEHARRVGDDPVRLFASLLLARETGRKQALASGLTEGTPEFAAVVEQAAIVRGHRNPTDADDDAAGANLKAYARWQQAARGEERPWWMAHLVGEASEQSTPREEQSKDAQIAGRLLAARSCGRTIASDAQVLRELRRHDSSWNLERWQEACAEHREWKREQRASRELQSSRRAPERLLPFVIDCNAGWEAVFVVEVEEVSEVETQRVPDELPMVVNA